MLLNKSIHTQLLTIFTDLGIVDRAYYVGGMVRDYLLGRPCVDIDIVVEKVTQFDLELLNNAFGDWKGKDFPVYKFHLTSDGGDIFDIDLAIARKEESNGDGYRDFDITYNENIDIHDDLARRDITMNAMAFPLSNLLNLIDDFNGEKDLRNGLIRHTTDAFAEDPLRVFRVARFASRYGFTVHSDTIELMRVLRPKTKALFKERVYGELESMFSSSKRPSTFFKVLKDSNNLEEWFPVIHQMIGLPHLHQNDVFNHTMEVIDILSSSGASIITLIGALYHDAGKILTNRDKLPKHYGHDKVGLRLVNPISERLRMPNKTTQCVRDCIGYHLKINRVPEMRISNLLKMVKVLTKNGTIDNVLALSIADRKSKGLNINDCITLEKIRVAQHVNALNTPKELQNKFCPNGCKPNSQRISNLILEWRVSKFKELLG
jgi:tRNA nucleotidyltransferase (CCA-adding enzyme)